MLITDNTMKIKEKRLRACIEECEGETWAEQKAFAAGLLGLTSETIDVYLSPSREISDHALELLEYKVGLK